MSKTSTDVLGCFWLPPNYYKLCSSGIDQNTVKPYKTNSCNSKDFQNCVLPLLRMQAEPYQDGRKYLRKSNSAGEGFSSVVNDALRELYKNRKGFVFTQNQLIEVLRFVPDANVSYTDEIYYVWK